MSLGGIHCYKEQEYTNNGTLGYFVKCRSSKHSGVLTCGHVVRDPKNKVLSRETGQEGHVQRLVCNSESDCTFITFRKEAISFQFEDKSQITLPVPFQGVEDIKGKRYKYYGNASITDGIMPVTGTFIESNKATMIIEGNVFRNVITLSEPVPFGDSGAVVLNEENNKPIGLVFACNKYRGFALPIKNVLDTLKVDFVNN